MTAADEAFTTFVADRYKKLLRTAYLLTGDAGHAEDLLQTALIKTYRHWDRIVQRDDPTAFVRRVMANTHASWRRRMRVSELFANPPLLRAEEPAIDIGEREAMIAALAQLPPRMRAVLVLRYYEDLSEAGTAEVLGCSINTVRTHTTRGLARLRAQLTVEAPCASAPEGLLA
jgi:RNA polymerase sigma-70 factor (sigma-E family)